jgi:Icc-related predicted phosphoesterase
MLLLCLSDIHGEGAGIASVLGNCPAVDAVVLVGDLTHLGRGGEAAQAVEPLLAAGLRVLAVPGNMDRPEVLGWLEERGLSLHGRGVTIGDIGFLGLGGSNPTPFRTPFEVPGPEASRLLEAAWQSVAAARCRVLVSHAPPRGTRLDRSAAHLHVGSAEVRGFLESHDVALCLCGHIHEAAHEEDTVGTARCVNVGAFKNSRYALVSIEPGDPRPRITITGRSL